MTQRSQQRWNTGKRAAAMRKAERCGFDQARLNPHWRREWLPGHFDDQIKFWSHFDYPCSPRLESSFMRGAWKWTESQPVEL